MIDVRDHLCVYDPRSDVFVEAEDSPKPREPGCGCDRCFHGRDALALHIERLTAEHQATRTRHAKELARQRVMKAKKIAEARAIAAGKDAPQPAPVLNREQALVLAEKLVGGCCACGADECKKEIVALVDEALAGKDGGR